MIIYNLKFITFTKCRNDPLLAAQNSKDSFSQEIHVITIRRVSNKKLLLAEI